MYKVFVNDIPLYLTDDRVDYEQFTGEKISYSEVENVAKLLSNIEEEYENGLLVIGESKDDLLKQLKCEFEFICAAGGLVVNTNGEYLFIKRHGKWDIPKGKMDKGEMPEETAVREVEEECGVDNLSITGKLVDTYHTYEYKGKPVLKKTYWYLMETSFNGELVPQTEEGITEVNWLKREEFEMVYSNTFKGIIDVLDSFNHLDNPQ